LEIDVKVAGIDRSITITRSGQRAAAQAGAR